MPGAQQASLCSTIIRARTCMLLVLLLRFQYHMSAQVIVDLALKEGYSPSKCPKGGLEMFVYTKWLLDDLDAQGQVSQTNWFRLWLRKSAQEISQNREDYACCRAFGKPHRFGSKKGRKSRLFTLSTRRLWSCWYLTVMVY